MHTYNHFVDYYTVYFCAVTMDQFWNKKAHLSIYLYM